MTINSQLSINEPKKKKEKNNKNKNEANNQNRNRIREMDITWKVFSGEGEGRKSGEKVQGRRSIISRHKIDRERSKMVQETENSKNLYVQPMDMN